MQNAWLQQFFFLVGTCCLKVSVLLFCHRMVDTSTQRTWRFVIFGVIAFTVAYTFAFCIVLICNCAPTRAYWKAYDPLWAASHDFKCVDTRALNPLVGALAIVSDLYSIGIPCVVCWNLRLPRKQKVGLYALFGASFVTIGAAGVRTWALYRVGVDYDASWYARLPNQTRGQRTLTCCKACQLDLLLGHLRVRAGDHLHLHTNTTRTVQERCSQITVEFVFRYARRNPGLQHNLEVRSLNASTLVSNPHTNVEVGYLNSDACVSISHTNGNPAAA